MVSASSALKRGEQNDDGAGHARIWVCHPKICQWGLVEDQQCPQPGHPTRPSRSWLAPRQFAVDHPLEGYRRLTFMMLDTDTVAVSPSSVYRVLEQAGLLNVHGMPYRVRIRSAQTARNSGSPSPGP